jgi:hypothetical protein
MSNLRLGLICLSIVLAVGLTTVSPAAAECYKTNSNTAKFMGISGTTCIESLESDGKFEESLLKEWRVDGAALTALQSVETTGEIKLVAESEPIIGTVEVLCSQILDGTISPGGAGEITELLTLTGVAISKTALSGTSLGCTNVAKCPSPELWVVGLPYQSKLESPTDDVITGSSGVGFEIKCKGIIGEPSDTCTQSSVLATLENSTTPETTVLSTINEIKKSNCSLAGSLEGSLITPSAASIKVLEGLVLEAV